MKITIFGSGYVGLVSAGCLAEMGHHVVCVDVDLKKITQLAEGILPIYEPGLSNILEKHLKNGTLAYTSDMQEGIVHGAIQVIAVGTPSLPDGSANLQYVYQVATDIGQYLEHDILVIDKSTVPVGTADRVEAIIQEQLLKRTISYQVDVVSNPEFLREGTALTDFLNPDRIIIGAETKRAKEIMAILYDPFKGKEILYMDRRSAELTKYAANAFLAMKISFINTMASISEAVGADIQSIAYGIGLDKRIGKEFLKAGCGYGGSCFPKDVQALERMAETTGMPSRLIQSIHEVNEHQKGVLFKKLQQQLDDSLEGKTIAIWGLAFKPNTDDIREAPSLVLIRACLKAGMFIRAYDPKANTHVADLFKNEPNLCICTDMYTALDGAHALAIMTEWSIFKEPDWEKMRNLLVGTLILDGRNLYEPILARAFGFNYQGIGRSSHEQASGLSKPLKSGTIGS